MDFAGIEGLDLATLGGADSVIVGDLSGTELDAVNLDLAATGGGGDAAADTILLHGTPGDDFVTLSGDPSGVSIAGLPAGVSISGGEPATDTLTIELGGGDDFLNATTVAAGALALSARGGEGDDILQGGEGDDTFFGEEGNDLLVGNGGVDVLDGGAGDNVVIQ
jgi:Ca2+-binding RTX toxin-like protein